MLSHSLHLHQLSHLLAYLPNPNQTEVETFVLVHLIQCHSRPIYPDWEQNHKQKQNRKGLWTFPLYTDQSCLLLKQFIFCFFFCLISAFIPGRINYIKVEKNAPQSPHTIKKPLPTLLTRGPLPPCLFHMVLLDFTHPTINPLSTMRASVYRHDANYNYIYFCEMYNRPRQCELHR